MDLTQHADARLRQRGFSRFTLHIIQRYGRCENVAGGAIKFFFGNKEHHQAVMELKDRIRPRKRPRNRPTGSGGRSSSWTGQRGETSSSRKGGS